MSSLWLFDQITAVVWQSKLHLFYSNRYDQTLRHATYDGTLWTFQILDGVGGSHGETTHDVGGNSIGAAGFSSGGSDWLFVSYYDVTSAKLRIGWRSASSGTWNFQDHDGYGGANGRISALVGADSTLVAAGNYLHLFYSDGTNGDLRQSWWGGSGDWGFQTIDGNGTFTSHNVAGAISAFYSYPYLHIFYNDKTAFDILHAWDNGGWSYQTFASTNSLSITSNSACFDGTYAHVFFTDSTNYDLMEAYGIPTSSWTTGTADGDSSSGGRISGVVTGPVACVPTVNGIEGAIYQNAGYTRLAVDQ